MLNASAASFAAARQGANRPEAIIVGASLSGLMTALALSRAGFDVTMLERSADTGRTGAALHVDHGLLERIVGSRAANKLDPISPGIQTWFTVHAGLRAAALSDPHITLHQQVSVETVGQDEVSAWAITADRQTFRGDVLIGADGHRSVVRRSVAPDRPDARFAGYLIWLGVAQESSLSVRSKWPTSTEYLSGGDKHLLCYPLPGKDGTFSSGGRQLGWALYDADHNKLLMQMGSVVDGVVQHSLRPSDIPEEVYRELAAEARQRWPSPWREAMLDCIERRSVIGTPIAEYVPERLVNGRVALVGDAAHVPTPMTGNGFSASLRDAEAIADSLAGLEIEEGLAAYERERLASVRGLVQGGQQFSRSFAAR